MKRADEIGAAWRDEAGMPPPAGDEQEFLRRLEARVSRAERRARRMRLLASSVLVPAALVVIALATEWLQRRGAPGRGAQDGAAPQPVATKSEPAQLTESPLAAMLLETARLRLDGLGDRERALPRLQEVIDRYPGTRSAAEALSLLEKVRGGS
ncbi:MAG: hypothetical protein AB1486_23170 [Planctomycetota bacterium]